MSEWGNIQRGRQLIVTDRYASPRARGAHSGVDFGVGNKEPFYAMHAGKCLVAGRIAGMSDGGYGAMIVIQVTVSGTKWDMLYAEFGDGTYQVKKGDDVKRGQLIGYGGSSAGSFSTGYHVHLSMIKESDGGYMNAHNTTYQLQVPATKYLGLPNVEGTFTLGKEYGAGGDDSDQSEDSHDSGENVTVTETLTNMNVFYQKGVL